LIALRLLAALVGLTLAASALAQGRPGAAAPPAATPASPATAPAAPATAPAAPAAAPAAAPQTPAAAAPAEPERNWAVTCTEPEGDSPRDCRLSTTVMLRPQNQRLAQVVLLRQPETRSLTMVLQAPHGAWLPGGIAWQVDEGEAQRLPFQSSDAEGLYAGIPVSDETLALLRRGSLLRLSFVTAARRETLSVPVPLEQFGAAVADLFARERARPR
jgi:invasion protein IalB